MSALSGIKVLDLSRRYPGAITAMYLGDFGAEVIKVDRPGDTLPVSFAKDEEKFSAYLAYDRNKKSIALDIRNEQGLEVLYRLAKQADVLIEGFRPGVMKKLKADYDTLKKMNPHLIYCSLSGWGQDGPYVQRPGHDANFMSIAGASSIIGPRKGPPSITSNLIGDVAGAGLHGAIGILLALMARGRTGRGQFVDISYLDGIVSMMSIEYTSYFMTGQASRRGESYATGGLPWNHAYKCKDGEYYIVCCGEPHFWKNFCQIIGREDLIPYHNPPPEKWDEVIEEVQKSLLTHTRDEWNGIFKDKEVCVSPVNYIEEAVNDPQILHRKMMVAMKHPKFGTIKQAGIPIKLSDTPGEIKKLGVPSGTDTDEILKSLGYKAADIKRLRQDKIVC